MCQRANKYQCANAPRSANGPMDDGAPTRQRPPAPTRQRQRQWPSANGPSMAPACARAAGRRRPAGRAPPGSAGNRGFRRFPYRRRRQLPRAPGMAEARPRRDCARQLAKARAGIDGRRAEARRAPRLVDQLAPRGSIEAAPFLAYGESARGAAPGAGLACGEVLAPHDRRPFSWQPGATGRGEAARWRGAAPGAGGRAEARRPATGALRAEASPAGAGSGARKAVRPRAEAKRRPARIAAAADG